MQGSDTPWHKVKGQNALPAVKSYFKILPEEVCREMNVGRHTGAGLYGSGDMPEAGC